MSLNCNRSHSHESTFSPRMIKANSHSKGYSLLELMVVMVVIGVMMSIAALSFGNFGSGFGEKTMKRLGYDVQLLSNEAIVRSEALALGFFADGYAFFRMEEENNSWVQIEKDRFLKPRKFDMPVKVRVLIGEGEVSLASQTGLKPHIFALPTGEVTPFIYQLESLEEEHFYEQGFDGLGRAIKEKDEKNTAQE